MTRPVSELEEAQRWIRWGMNDCAIGRLTGIPRETIRDWRLENVRADDRKIEGDRRSDCPQCDGTRLDEPAYAYLLGLYLGDGFIATHPRQVYRLRISLDQRYTGIIEECKHAIALVRSGLGKVGVVQSIGCVEVNAYWKHWPCVFPQHGEGRKHERRIVLARWQEEVVRRRPALLLRGLIHSDGYRGLNWVNGKGYPRYQFCNASDDIRAIFCRACDDYGVSWRRMNARNISIAKAPDVAKLDLVVGPKR